MGANFTPDELERLLVHADWLRALARRLVHDSAAADDLVQETWVAALKAPPDLKQPLRPWLAAVLRNLAALSRRTEGRRAQRNAAAARSERLPSTAELIATVDLQQRLAQLVVGLAEPLRTTVLLRYHEGLSSAEIARIQGVPAGTVRWRLKRGLDQLRVELDDRYGARESWLASLVAFARVEPARSVAPGGALGLMPLVVSLLAAACVALFALNPGACARSGGARSAPLAAPAQVALADATPAPEAAAGPLDALERGARIAAASRPARSTLRLVDARGAPVAGVRVIVPLGTDRAGAPVDGLTDATGALALFTDEPTYEVFVARPGAFVHRADATPVDGLALVVLPDGATLGGRVVARGAGASAPGGAPEALDSLASLVLELDSDRHLWGGRELPPEVAARLGNGRRTAASTDGGGRFEFHGLASDWSGVLWLPGSHRVVGARSGAYSDESLYLSGATRDLVIEVEPRGTVTGRVVGEDHVGLVGATLTAFTPFASAPLTARSGADGRFRFELAPGAARELVLDVRADPLGATTTHRVPLVPPDGRLGDLVIARAVHLDARTARAGDLDASPLARRLDVTVVDGEGRPMSDAYLRVRAREQLFCDEASARPDAGDPPRPAHGAGPRALRSGPTYALYVLGPAGRLELPNVVADAPLQLTLEDAAGVVLERRDLPGASPGATTAVGFCVVEPLLSLDVTVRDEAGELLVGAMIQLGARGERGVFRRTGLAGRTVFAGLSPATTRVDVEVTKRGFATAHQRDVVLEQPEGTGQALRLQLELARGTDSTFIVLDEADQPVTDAIVRVVLGAELVLAARHTGEGRYQVLDLPRAALEVEVQRGDLWHTVTVDPSAGPTSIIVRLPPPSSATGVSPSDK